MEKKVITSPEAPNPNKDFSTELIKYHVDQAVKAGDFGDKERAPIIDTVLHRTLWSIYPPAIQDIYNFNFRRPGNIGNAVASIISSDGITENVIDDARDWKRQDGGEMSRTNKYRIYEDAEKKFPKIRNTPVLTFAGFMPLDQLITHQIELIKDLQDPKVADPGELPIDSAGIWKQFMQLQEGKEGRASVKHVLHSIIVSPRHLADFAEALYALSIDRIRRPIIEQSIMLKTATQGFAHSTRLAPFELYTVQDTALYNLPANLRRKLIENGIGYEQLQTIDYSSMKAKHRMPVNWEPEIYFLLSNMGLEHSPLFYTLGQVVPPSQRKKNLIT